MIHLNIGRKYFILLFTIIPFILIIYLYIKISNNYERDFKALDEARLNLSFHDPFVLYYQRNGKCPISLDSLFPILPNNELDSLKLVYFWDILSKKNQIFKYYTLYNEDTIKDAYILVSTGIDRKLNNEFNLNDTVFKYDFNTQFKFYNHISALMDQFAFLEDTLCNEFNIFYYLFGKKDYLVCYVDLPQWD